MLTNKNRGSKPVLLHIILCTSLFLCILSYSAFDLWFLDFLIQFRIHLSALLFVIACTFLFFREFLFAVLLFCVSSMFLLPVIQVYQDSLTNSCAVNPQVNPIHVITFNKHMLNNDYDKILALIKIMDPDILFLLETDETFFDALNDQFNELNLFADNDFSETIHYRSMLYSKYPVDNISIQLLPNGWQRVLEAEIYHSVHNISFFGIHTQSPKTKERMQSRDSHILSLADYIAKEEEQKRPIIVAGDLNSVPWHPTLKDFRNKTSLKYRMPDNAFGTWPSWVPFSMGVMIDHIFFNKKLYAAQAHVLKSAGSDHLPVSNLLYFCE